jgi:hypothetical protein
MEPVNMIPAWRQIVLPVRNVATALVMFVKVQIGVPKIVEEVEHVVIARQIAVQLKTVPLMPQLLKVTSFSVVLCLAPFLKAVGLSDVIIPIISLGKKKQEK